MSQIDELQTAGSDDTATETHSERRDWTEAGSPALGVVAAVAAAKGVNEEDVRPLVEVVDPDSLDRLFVPSVGSLNSGGPRRVSFRFEGCDVTVHADGRTVASRRNVEQ